MHVLVICKYKKDRIKNNREKVEKSFPHYKSMGSFCCHGHQSFDPICLKTLCSLSPLRVMLHIKFDQDWPTCLRDSQVRTCKIFVIQGQITPKWVVWPGPKSNSSELLCLSWLPATLMMIRSKMNELAWRQHFPIISLWEFFKRSRAANSVVRSGRNSNSSEILCMSPSPASIKMIGLKTTEKMWRHRFPYYKSMGDFCWHGNQSFDPICCKTLCSLSPPQMMLHIKFDQDWPTGFRDIQVWKWGRRTDHWYTISSTCEPSAQVSFFVFLFVLGFTAQSTTRSYRAGQVIVALFQGRLRPSKRLTSTKRGRPRQ